MSVTVYLCPVPEIPAGVLAALYGQLRAHDRTRADRFVVERARRLFVVAHRTVDFALTQAGLDYPVIATGNHGKPYLSHHPDVHFNLSHTEGMIAVAVARHVSIGVDVERRPERTHDLAAIAARVFTPSEQATMTVSADPVTIFTQFWTAKEAIMKATGLGFHLPAKDIELTVPGPQLRRLPPAHADASTWWLHAEAIGDTWLALAAPRPTVRIVRKIVAITDLASA
ncbi:MAG: 4'-phosphopantetheinyl transferase superfamily protein [Gammaproteobacteria bacterium]|nr:4'-phosphopantetheinyl transferase superfamily protein [Gammaproteobacteria bacterium]